MKTYKELKEQVLEENFMEPVTNMVLGKPVSNKPPADVARQSAGYDYGPDTKRGGVFGKGGLASQGMDYFKKNKGMIGAVGAGVVGLGLLTGLIRGRQGRRDNAPQGGTVPAPNLQQTTVSAPSSVGTPTERISRAVTQISPVKPIDNRTSRNA